MSKSNLYLLTAEAFEVPILWIGVSDLDGSLRFETTETNIAQLVSIFDNEKHTACLTRYFDTDAKDFCGFTRLKGIERMEGETTVVRLLPESEGAE